MIQLRDIHKEFDNTPILKGITTEFKRGKTNLVIGQSGSGKTVLLKILLGLFTPNQGEIYFDGIPFSSMSDDEHRVLRREIGMVFQGSALFDSMSVIENVLFPMRMLTKLSESEMIDQAETVIERVNLIDAKQKLPNEISGGMQKRVAIARAVVMRPKYLFCDEPNSGLDPKTAIVIDNLIQELTKEYNITTVINSHDMNSVMEIGEYIVFIGNTKKLWEGNSDDIMHSGVQELDDFVFANKMMRKFRSLS